MDGDMTLDGQVNVKEDKDISTKEKFSILSKKTRRYSILDQMSSETVICLRTQSNMIDYHYCQPEDNGK